MTRSFLFLALLALSGCAVSGEQGLFSVGWAERNARFAQQGNDSVQQAIMGNPCRHMGMSDQEFEAHFRSRTTVRTESSPHRRYVPGYGNVHIEFTHRADGMAEYSCWRE